MEIRARYILIGLFTLAVILGGFGFVYWLETKGGIGKRTNYEIQFQGPVSGLLTGSTVLFNGIRAGEVTEVRLSSTNPREIDAVISIDATAPIRRDTRVTIDFQGLTGVPAVALIGGSASAPPVEAPPGGGLPRLIASETAGQSLTEAARETLNRLDGILSENSGDVRNMVKNLSTFAEALGRNSEKVDGILSGLDKYLGGKGAGQSLVLTALPEGAVKFEHFDKRIAVADPSALLAVDSEKMLVQGPNGDLSPLGSAKWGDNLGKLLQAKIIQSFENNGELGVVNRPIDTVVADFQLMTEIRHFALVPSPEPRINAEITAKLVSKDGDIAGSQVFKAEVPVASQEPVQVAKAMDEGFHQIMTALVPWVAETVAEAPPPPAPQKESGNPNG